MIIVTVVILTFIVLYIFFHRALNKECLKKQEIDDLQVSKYKKSVHYFYSDSFKLYGELLVAKNSSVIVITVSGWGSNHQKFASLNDILYEKNISSFSVDMRYQGFSEGSSICAGYKEPIDILNAIKYLKTLDETKDLKIVLMGVSMGASTVLSTIDKRICGIVAFAPFSDVAHVINDQNKLKGLLFVYSKIYFMLKFGLKLKSPIKLAESISVPTLIIHCMDDKTVKVKESYKFKNKFKSDSNFDVKVYDGSSHTPWINNSQINENVVNDVICFIKERI